MSEIKENLDKVRSSLKKAFGTAAIIGIIIIFMFLNASSDGYSQFLLIFPMVGYMIYGNQLAKKYQYMPDFADSVYYLGFSFTLISLFGATVLEKLKAEPEEIVSYFGMALSTTILGILYRTYHSQFTDLNEDPIEKAKKELEDELATFSADLHNLFHMTNSSLSFLERDIPEKFSKSIKNIEEKLTYSFMQLEEDISAISKNYSRINNDIQTAYSRLNKNVKDSSSNISENFAEISSNMNIRSQEINRSIDNIQLQVKEFQQNTKSYSDEIVGNGDITGSYGKLTNTLKSYIEGMDDFTKKVKDTTSDFDEILKSLRKTAKTVNNQTNQIEKIFSDANKVLENKLN